VHPDRGSGHFLDLGPLASLHQFKGKECFLHCFMPPTAWLSRGETSY
jgi:hypothetical protein